MVQEIMYGSMPCGLASTWNQIAPKFFRHFLFSSKKILPYELSHGIFLDFSDFKPEIIRPEKFQSKNFCDFQLSTGKFSGKKNFAAKKSPGFPIPVPGQYRRIYDGGASQLPN